jgi:Domain of unknown function (DUF5679)
VVVTEAGMRQVGPHTWVFTPPDVAPMKGYCRNCNQSVAMRHPSEVTLATGNYIVRGECELCRQEVILLLT